MPYRSPCAFNLPADPTAQTHAFDRRAQGGFAVQFRLGARQNFSVEGAVGLLAGLGAKFQIAVDAPAEGALQLRRSPALKMNHIPKPGDRAGECLILRIEVDGASGITFVFHHGFTEELPPGAEAHDYYAAFAARLKSCPFKTLIDSELRATYSVLKTGTAVN